MRAPENPMIQRTDLGRPRTSPSLPPPWSWCESGSWAWGSRAPPTSGTSSASRDARSRPCATSSLSTPSGRPRWWRRRVSPAHHLYEWGAGLRAPLRRRGSGAGVTRPRHGNGTSRFFSPPWRTGNTPPPRSRPATPWTTAGPWWRAAERLRSTASSWRTATTVAWSYSAST